MTETTIEAIRKRAQAALDAGETGQMYDVLELCDAIDIANRTIAERDAKIESLNRGLLQLTHDKLDRGALLIAKSAECERLRAETVEECAKAQCMWCAKSAPFCEDAPNNHLLKYGSEEFVQPCHSVAIRALSPKAEGE